MNNMNHLAISIAAYQRFIGLFAVKVRFASVDQFLFGNFVFFVVCGMCVSHAWKVIWRRTESHLSSHAVGLSRLYGGGCRKMSLSSVLMYDGLSHRVPRNCNDVTLTAGEAGHPVIQVRVIIKVRSMNLDSAHQLRIEYVAAGKRKNARQ